MASAPTWAELHVTPRNPSARWTSAFARRVAQELAARGWRLEAVMTDNAAEFRAQAFRHPLAHLGAQHRLIRAGRPQTHGCVERVPRTIREECWKPAFARALVLTVTGLRRDLERYLVYDHTARAHTGRWTTGRTPDEVLGKARIWS